MVPEGRNVFVTLNVALPSNRLAVSQCHLQCMGALFHQSLTNTELMFLIHLLVFRYKWQLSIAVLSISLITSESKVDVYAT